MQGSSRRAGTPRLQLTVVSPAEIFGGCGRSTSSPPTSFRCVAACSETTNHSTSSQDHVGCEGVIVLVSGKSNMSTVRALPRVLRLVGCS